MKVYVYTSNTNFVKDIESILNPSPNIQKYKVLNRGLFLLDFLNLEQSLEDDVQFVMVISPSFLNIKNIMLLVLLMERHYNRLTIVLKLHEIVEDKEISINMNTYKDLQRVFHLAHIKQIPLIMGDFSDLLYVFERRFGVYGAQVPFNIKEYTFTEASLKALKEWVETETERLQLFLPDVDLALKALLLINERNNITE